VWIRKGVTDSEQHRRPRSTHDLAHHQRLPYKEAIDAARADRDDGG
jgi:hypothetical protein